MKKEVGVAFSGSGFKVPAHVGALVALEDLGYNIVEVSGTSGGSIIAAMYACGVSSREMTHITMTKDWSDMIEFEILALAKGCFCTGYSLYNYLYEMTSGKTFSQTKVPLTVIASDMAYNTPFVFSTSNTPEDEVALAIRASASIPFVYTPVIHEDKYLVDGGVVNNIPIDRLQVPPEQRIGIQMHSEKVEVSSGNTLKWPWNMASRILNLLIQNSENTHISKSLVGSSSMIYIESGFADSLDTNMSSDTRRQLYDAGYNSTIKKLATSAS